MSCGFDATDRMGWWGPHAACELSDHVGVNKDRKVDSLGRGLRFHRSCRPG